MFLSATSTISTRKPLFYFIFSLSCLIIPWHASAKPTAQVPTIEVTTCADLQNIKNGLAGQYVLTGDINCSGVNFSPIGTTADPFIGSLDGAGHKIQNLLIQNTNDYTGLFGVVNNAHISRLTLENAQICERDREYRRFNWLS